jgi:precorrin-4 methylase
MKPHKRGADRATRHQEDSKMAQEAQTFCTGAVKVRVSAVTRVHQQCVQYTRRWDTPVGVVLDD